MPTRILGKIELVTPGETVTSGGTPDGSLGNECFGLTGVTLSALAFGGVAALVKIVDQSPLAMLQIQNTVQWLWALGALICSGVPCRKGWTVALAGEPHLKWFLILRALLYFGFLILWWFAVERMPVGDATTIVFACSPPLAAFLARVVLGESLPRYFISCVTLSIVGAALITRPEFIFGPSKIEDRPEYVVGAFCALGSCLFSAGIPLLLRVTKETSWMSVEHVSAFTGASILAPGGILVLSLIDYPNFINEAFFGWTAKEFGYLVAASTIAFFGSSLQTVGYQNVRAARGNLMAYIEIPFSFLLQYLIWDDPLTWSQGAGALLILISGALNVMGKDETGRADEPSSEFYLDLRSDTA